jgi:hypothetical protein
MIDTAAIINRDEKTMEKAIAGEALQALTNKLLQKFKPAISIRIAFELCQSEGNSPEPVTLETARDIVRNAWKTTLDKTPSAPIVLIAGGGTGSGKLTACRNPSLGLQTETSLIYDASEEPILFFRSLIEQAHKQQIPIILAYIQRPLRDAAIDTILNATNEGVTPAPEAFALSHVNALDNFLSLVAHFKKKKELFSPAVVFNSKTNEPYSTSHRELKHARITKDAVADVFLQAWKDLHEGMLLTPTRLRPLAKARKSKRTLINQTLLIAHLISQTIRTNVNQGLREHRVIETGLQTDTKASDQFERQHHISRRPFTSTDAWRTKTLAGQTRVLDRESPPHVVVREKKTHVHEMEVTLER